MLNFKNFIRDLFNEHCTIPTSNLAYCLCLCFQTELGNKDQVTMWQHFGLSWHANKRKNVKPCVLNIYSGLGICSLVIRANRSFYVSEGRIAKVQFALKKLANNSHHSLFKSVSLSSLFFKEIDTESLMVAL